ncbi:MAG: hypothetical protein Q9218_003153 [Villophora microphyllina]
MGIDASVEGVTEPDPRISPRVTRAAGLSLAGSGTVTESSGFPTARGLGLGVEGVWDSELCRENRFGVRMGSVTRCYAAAWPRITPKQASGRGNNVASSDATSATMLFGQRPFIPAPPSRRASIDLPNLPSWSTSSPRFVNPPKDHRALSHTTDRPPPPRRIVRSNPLFSPAVVRHVLQHSARPSSNGRHPPPHLSRSRLVFCHLSIIRIGWILWIAKKTRAMTE